MVLKIKQMEAHSGNPSVAILFDELPFISHAIIKEVTGKTKIITEMLMM
jgi:hypothetical protein